MREDSVAARSVTAEQQGLPEQEDGWSLDRLRKIGALALGYRLAFVWLVFVGVASSMRRGELMRFNMIRDRFPQAARRLVDSASWLLVAGASLLAALGAWQQVQYGWGNHSTVVGYPVVLGMFPVLACMGVLALLALLQLVNVWRRPEPLPVANANITAD
jgi:gluconokinase